MRATVHIGTIKTGTSSIQRLLYDNCKLLLRQGCLYPRSQCHLLAASIPHLAGHNPLAVQLAYGWPLQLQLQLRAELTASRCGHLLFSSDMLMQCLLTEAGARAAGVAGGSGLCLHPHRGVSARARGALCFGMHAAAARGITPSSWPSCRRRPVP